MRSGNIILNNLSKQVVGEYEDKFIKDYVSEDQRETLETTVTIKRDPGFDALYSNTKLQERVWNEITALVEVAKLTDGGDTNKWIKTHFTDKDNMTYLTVYIRIGQKAVYNTVAFSRPLGRVLVWNYFPCSNKDERSAESIYGIPRKVIKEIIVEQRRACGTHTYHYGMLGSPKGLVVGFDQLAENEQLTTIEEWLDENITKETLVGILNRAINSSVGWLVEKHKSSGNLSIEQLKELIIKDVPESLIVYYQVHPLPISTLNVIDALKRKHTENVDTHLTNIIVNRALNEIGLWNTREVAHWSFMKDLEGIKI